ncbi:aquaporin-11-like [Limulus polyphemus]|uniref:Aquaporin-11-like n=1 Tax=Limulus polyphemus TaxID=6850 RepID=A0ABM1TL13_LIMPO|nr:aquaporin-11-like [Limulus polyphemus]XP_022256564.1 aquaporin-11-like [Limulus polyphemus]XP_022256565.1 aquaporin-11-like [Limulus polyphemus]XP_022256566.1 aquaporin-11-like [Limulus polyphemus]XP_022256567.1 aquaporin-11-like [Limulus polyphemus]XP_022256568.1 aquaporin-11-like [Limulus polyphemus]XP_022256569.1 aquaporin-11-like [Limulus polyphemus]
MSVPVPEAFIPYTVLVFNIIFFKIMRGMTFAVIPHSFRPLVAELISTLELCSDCAELGVVYERHGSIALGLALGLVCFWWCQVFEDTEACPCGPIEDYVLRIPSPSGDISKKLLGQVIGGIITTWYIKSIWSFHLVTEHRALHTAQQCEAGLQVTILWGALIEGFITFISRLVALQSGKWDARTAAIANSITTVVLVLAALNTTGGFFNPILASALTLGCHGNTIIEHFIVYWIGALIGGLIARVLHQALEGTTKEKGA